MKIKVVSLYAPNSDFSRLETEPPSQVVIESNENEVTLDIQEIFHSKLENLKEFELKTQLTLDYGFENESSGLYMVTVTEIFDSFDTAQTKCQVVYDYVMDLLLS